MSTIKISDLRPTGSELFSDSESYMNELGDSQLDIINGGATTSPVCAVTIVSAIAASLVFSPAARLKQGGGGKKGGGGGGPARAV